MSHQEFDFWQRACSLQNSGTPFVVVTFVSCRGEAPQDPGAKAIVTPSGLALGTVGGGKIEKRAIEYALEWLKAEGSAPPRLEVWNLQRDIGMTCGGEVTFLFERFGIAPLHITVFGAGHVAQALVRTLLTLDCQITCLDTRMEWIQKLPESAKLSTKVSTDLASEVPAQRPNSFFVVMTQGHATDLPILEAIFRTTPQAPYVGVLGSELKARRIRNDLLSLGISNALIETLHCPMGLTLGQNAPSEMAISITAQLLQVRDRLTQQR